MYVNRSIPTKTDGQIVMYSECHVYSNEVGGAYDIIGGNRPINSSQEECNEWVYDQSVFRSTFTAQVNVLIRGKRARLGVRVCVSL